MPISRQHTPPTNQTIQEHGVLDTLSKWTADEDSDAENAAKGKADSIVARNSWTGRHCFIDPDSDVFNLSVGLVICLNCIIIALETTFGNVHFRIFEHLFTMFFVLEMCIRMAKGGWRYFCEAWNIFDFTLVMASSLDLWILPAINSMSSTSKLHKSEDIGYSLSAMRLLRILRILRILRMLRLFRLFNQLNLIMQAFTKAFQVVLMVTLIVIILDYICAVILVECVGLQAELWGEDADKIEAWFGSISKAMQTLFQIMTLSDWDTITVTLAKVVPIQVVFMGMLCYIMVASYTSSSLIVAIITDSLTTAQTDYERHHLVKGDEKRKVLAKRLKTFLMELHGDEMDENVCIPAEDLKISLKGDTELIAKLAGIRIFIDERGLADLVDRIAAGETKVSVPHFVDKLTHLTGMASASQVADLRYEMAKVQQQADVLLQHIEPLPGELLPPPSLKEPASSAAIKSSAAALSSSKVRSVLKKPGAKGSGRRVEWAAVLATSSA